MNDQPLNDMTLQANSTCLSDFLRSKDNGEKYEKFLVFHTCIISCLHAWNFDFL